MFETEKNLQSAFSGESQANCRYLAFAARADEEGYPQIARLFRAVAEAETVHANNHFNVMGGVGTIKDHVLAGSTGEHLKITRMYPPFIEQAVVEKNERAVTTFEHAYRVGQIHFQHFEKALDALKKGAELEDMPYHVCRACGNTIFGEAPDKCPICGASPDMFILIE
jgi:rubrerythrin